MSEEIYIPRYKDGTPLFFCRDCLDRSGLTTTDGQVLQCSVCGWKLVLTSENETHLLARIKDLEEQNAIYCKTIETLGLENAQLKIALTEAKKSSSS